MNEIKTWQERKQLDSGLHDSTHMEDEIEELRKALSVNNVRRVSTEHRSKFIKEWARPRLASIHQKEDGQFASPVTQEAWGIWQAAIASQAPRQALTDAEIPVGVCWSEQGCNFYRADTGAGMGNAFYDEWRDRCDEFPDRDTARKQIATTSPNKELVVALQMLLKCEGSFGKRVDAVNKAHAALAAVGVEP